MKNAGIYYRVSTDKQELKSQKLAVETWLAQLPEAQRPESIHTYQDIGISGTTTQRPGYQDMLRDAYRHIIDTIIVYRLDRLSRNASYAIQTLLSLDQAGIAFISVSQPVLNLGHDNPFRRTMLAAFSEIAEIERNTIVERVRSGLQAAKNRGVVLGRPQKFSRQDRDRVVSSYQAGLTQREIAKQTGISSSSVQRILQAAKKT